MINSDWSRGFNTNSSVDDIVLYKSPYSPNIAYNSRQGKISNGVITTEYDPPELLTEAPTGASVYTDRLNLAKTNPAPMEVRDAVDAGMSVEESFRQKRKREKYGVPGLKDSHIIHAGYPIETYKKPGRKENFSQEDSRVLIIISLAIVSICSAGFTLGVLVPKIKINHKVKMVEKVQKPAVEERAEAF